MIRKINIRGLNITFVFRHKWDKISKDTAYNIEFKNYELGLWFRLNRMVGRKNFRNTDQWKNNMVNLYKIGVNLLVAKCWIEIHYKGMIF